MNRFARWIYRTASRFLKRWGGRVAARGRRPGCFRRILVVRMWAVGELVMATPVLRALREAYPEARIDLLVGRSLAPLARGLPWIDECIAVEEGPLLAGRPGAWLGLVAALRRRRYDLGLCLHQSVLLAVLIWLAGVRWRVGFDRDGEGFSHHVRVSCNVPGRHQVDEYLANVRALGLEPRDPWPEVRWDDAAGRAADVALAPLAGRRFRVGLAPTGGHNLAAAQLGTNVHLKRWPPSHYVELARELSRSGDVGLVLLGGAAEAESAAAIAAAVPAAVDLSSRLDLATLAAVTAALDLVIANDSGPMHVAAAAGTRVLALFGPTDAALCGPRSPRATVLADPLPCSPCFRRDAVPPSFPDCPHQQCLRDLLPGRVARTARDLLGA
jgi:lipopolysaccharide heptosyltransferase II